MVTNTSATALEATPHTTETTREIQPSRTVTISDGLRRRAQSVITDISINPQWRVVVRYALETNDPWLADLVQRAETGETIIDTIDFSRPPETSNDDPND